MEANNMKAMRDEVSGLLAWAESNLRLSPDLLKEGTRECCEMVVACCKSALSEPPRQCDAGTPDEQAERFENFCLKHIGCAEETGGKHCLCCPLVKASEKITQKCELHWAQMPYKEGKTDGIK